MNASNLFTIEDCDKIVRKCLKCDKEKSVEFSVTEENETFRIKIKTEQEKILNFLAVPTSIQPAFGQILEDFSKTIPKFESKITPNFYTNSDFIFFEDLREQGFQKYPKSKIPDLGDLKIVLRLLAKLHAGSFAFEEIISKEGESYRLNEHHNLNRNGIDLTQPVVIDLISSLLEDKNDKISEILKILEERQSSTKFRRTFSHGNLIFENVMFKHEQNSVDCRLFNYKSEGYFPPCYDVLQLIFFNSNENLRQHHFHELLSHYYESLKEELLKYSFRIDDIVSISDWQNQIHQFLPLIKLECVLLKKNPCLEELKEDMNCPLLSRQDCYTIIRNKLKTTSYELLSFKVDHLDTVTGFLGDYHKLQIKFYHELEQSLKCFVKCTPKSGASKNIVQDSNCFSKEVFFFNTLIPKFLDFGIDIINECVPICYFQRPDDVMVLEDLSILGFQSTPSLVPYEFDTLSMIMKKLAKFHASGLIYEEKMSKKLGRPYRLYDEYAKYLQEEFIVEDDRNSAGVQMTVGAKCIPNAAKLFPEFQTESNQKNLETLWPKLLRSYYDCLKPSDNLRNVLTHGDLWSSNILLKHNAANQDCRFVDFQLIRYCPPSHDFLAVLHLATIREIRLRYEPALREIYYNELKNILLDYDLEVENIITFEDFLAGIDLMRPQMLIQAGVYVMLCMCTPEQVTSMLGDEEEAHKVFFVDRTDFFTKMCQVSEIYRSRMRDRILDIYDYCNTMCYRIINKK